MKQIGTRTATVTRYDWTLYHQAVALAKKQLRKDGDYQKYQAECQSAYARLMKSPDTETQERNLYVI